MQNNSPETKLTCKIKSRDFWRAHLCVRFYKRFSLQSYFAVFNSQEVSHLLKKSFSICKTQMTTVMPMSLHYSSLGDCTKMVIKNAKLQQMLIQIKKYFSHHWYSAKLHVQIHSKERIHGSNKRQSQIYCDNA